MQSIGQAMAMRRSILVLLLGAASALFSPGPVAADEPLKLVFAGELVPLSFEKDGQIAGILVDIAREVFVTRLGQKVALEIYPWERAQQMVKAGAADGFISIATEARKRYANCGRIPVLSTPLHPVVRRDHPKLSEIEKVGDLDGLRVYSIVSYSGNGWAKQNLAGFDVFFASDFPASLRGLAQGRGDVAFVTNTAGSYFLRESGLDEKLAVLPMVVDRFDYVLCIGKKSAHIGMLSEFDRVLEILRLEGGDAAILKHYGLGLEAQR